VTINGKNIVERLPFLLERAAELGVPVEVRPHISRTGVDHIVASATVTLHADVGTPGPDLDIEGQRESGRLVGTWLQIVGAQDLEFAANTRRHRVIDIDERLPELSSHQTYTAGPAVEAAAALLGVDLAKDEIPDAVHVEPEVGAGPVQELVVDWAAVTAPSRSHGVVTLALTARSLLHGDPVDLSGLAHVSPDYAGIAEYAFSKLAAAGRDSARGWLAEDEQLGEDGP
jgi:hypothetical protein